MYAKYNDKPGKTRADQTSDPDELERFEKGDSTGTTTVAVTKTPTTT